MIALNPVPGIPWVAVSFPFDPQLIALVKAVPGRKWDQKTRSWYFPHNLENIASFLATLPSDIAVSVHPALRTSIAERTADIAAAQTAKHNGDSTMAFDYVTAPYAHQRVGFEVLTRLGSAGLTWEMGTGKTKTAIDYCEWLARKDPDLRVLVITPLSVCRNWAAEIEKHAGHKDYIVLAGGSLAKRAKQLASARYTIVNPEALSLAPLSSAIVARPWSVVIADESTRFKTPGARRTKNLHKLSASRRVILTGTPITGKPEDAWSQFEFVAPGLFGSWWAYADRYLVKDYFKRIVGVKPEMIGELRAKIEQHSYRVLKSAVLDLPPKVYTDRRVTLEGEQRQAYEQMRKQLVIEMADMPHVSAATILTQLLRLTQITAGLVGEGERYRWLPDGAKVSELDDLLLDELAGEQVVIFGVYQRELEELAERYAPRETRMEKWSGTQSYRWDRPIIYGPTPEKRRHELVEQFQAGLRRLLFVQEHTGGFGINLTAAKTLVYTSRTWSLEDWLQSADRAHRIGQTGTVAVVSLIASGTVDEQIAAALADKAELADKLTGDQARRLAAEVLGGTK